MHKALYGLKQAPRAWYEKIDRYLLDLGFKRSLSEFTLYIKKVNHSVVVLSLYVDDLLVTGNDVQLIENVKQGLFAGFEMTDLEKMAYFLGLEIKQSPYEIFICQRKYLKEILKKFQMEECRSVSTPMAAKEKLQKSDGTEAVDVSMYRSLIGCLMYLTTTRPDILFAISVLSRFMSDPS